jgi:hypothetical protein
VSAPGSRADRTPQLSAQTLAWLADRTSVRTVVRTVWTTVDDLEREGHDPGVLAALRAVLIDHQPVPRTGRCRACPRLSWRRLWRRRRFPCLVWIRTHLELHGLFSESTPLRGGR